MLRLFPEIVKFKIQIVLEPSVLYRPGKWQEYVLMEYDKNVMRIIVCGNKMPTRCNRGFYCRSYCLLNMFRASVCPSSGAQEYYTVVAACGILCCKNVKIIFYFFCGIWVLSLKCRVLSKFVTRCVECCWGCVWVCVIVASSWHFISTY